MAPIVHWAVLFAFWLVLSGVFDVQHVVIGFVATAVVARQGRPAQLLSAGGDKGALSHLASIPWGRVWLYTLWLLREIVRANLQIARVVLDPRLPIEPAIVRVPARVTSDAEITLLANSITATPGTVTVHSPENGRGEFVIHALVEPQGVAASVRDMEDRVIDALGGRRRGRAT